MDGLPHEYGDALGQRLLHDISAMPFDRPHADIQPDGNDVTSAPLHDEVEDFDLSRELQTDPPRPWRGTPPGDQHRARLTGPTGLSLACDASSFVRGNDHRQGE